MENINLMVKYGDTLLEEVSLKIFETAEGIVLDYYSLKLKKNIKLPLNLKHCYF